MKVSDSCQKPASPTFQSIISCFPDQIHILVLMVQKEDEIKCVKIENSLS